MGYLKRKVVYLSGPIAAVKNEKYPWNREAKKVVKSFGIKVIDPVKQKIDGLGETKEHKQYFKELLKKKKFKKVKELFWPILRRDLRATDVANFLIWYYDPEIPTTGATHEVVNAAGLQKPVLMFIPEEKLGQVSPWALTFSKHTQIFTKWDNMKEYLKKIDNKQFDSSKWIF